MAINPQNELIWEGRLHLGDEPGVFGDAAFCGLAAELPLTVRRPDPEDTQASRFKLLLETEDLETYVGYPGHRIEVLVYEPDPAQPGHALERVLAEARFSGADHNRKEVLLDVGPAPGPIRLSVRLRSDTTVNPGFYDDFVWLRLRLITHNFDFYASFGFSS